jgi:outer membrane protein assembly factor BamB
LAALAKRLELERRVESRRRHLDVRGGEGLFASGLIVILITLAVNPDRMIAVPIWVICVGLITCGLWQLRANPSSLRATGAILGIGAALMLGFVGVRALQASQASDPPPAIPLLATPTMEASEAATPGTDRVTGEVPMAGGNAFHDGIMPGPAPSSAPGQLWQFDTGGEVHGAATLSNGRLFVMSKSGSLLAIDADTGQQLWSVPITGYVTRVSPAVSDGVVFAGGGFAFGAWDAATGKQLWTVPLQYVGQSSPVLTDELVIVSSQERWTYALDRESGDIVWRVPTEGIVFGAPAISEGKAFYATDEGIVYAVDLDSGRVVWRQTVTGSIFGSPVVSQGLILVTTQAGEFAALDSQSGSIRWTALHGGSNPPATNGDIVVIADADGGIYGLDLATGDQRWLYPTGRPELTSPSLADNLALIGAGSTILALDLDTGEAAWYFLAGDIVDTAPVVADGRVFFGSRDGFVTAVGLPD